eukprot:TRINITY_DN40754_c0_g1_i1.p1 TRINITY_DN40754_c0_g1~~TRINITY_DN40754_c0_g1_i1.p1  ORF type:complete len:236 (+),score=37.75 TRINITY_DN40754_c0_g1_i1:68-709(+)
MVALQSCSVDELRVVEVSLPQIEAFKVVGDQQSILAYDAAHRPRAIGEWSAIYFQLNAPHAKGTVAYRWDMGYDLARLLKIDMRNVNAIIVDASWFPDGSIGGDEKAAVLKEALQLPLSEPLTKGLEQRKVVLVCRETEDQWELVVPRGLLPGIISVEEELLQFRPNACLGGPDQCRSSGDDQPWRKVRDAEALEFVPPPAWITEALASSSSR